MPANLGANYPVKEGNYAKAQNSSGSGDRVSMLCILVAGRTTGGTIGTSSGGPIDRQFSLYKRQQSSRIRH
jgi:hypothetical protein